MSTLEISLLGPPTVLVGHTPLQVDTRKAVALLAYLACADSPVPRDRAALLLWPEAPADSARSSLRRTLSALRKGLGGAWLESDRHQLTLTRTAEVTIDVREFETLVGNGADLDQLAAGTGLYRGDFMAGFTLKDSPEFDDWQIAQAETLRGLAAAALERLSIEQQNAGDITAGLTSARRWLDLDPLHEAAHRRLMLLYARSGDRGAAVRQYRECVRVLEDELGVPPLNETNQLYRDIVEDNLDRPIRAPDTAPPTAGAAARPESGLIGRERELQLLRAAHVGSAGGLRVVAVAGEPGIGKTRLIAEVTDRLDPGTPRLWITGHRSEQELAFAAVIDAVRTGLELDGSQARLKTIAPASLVEAARLVPELRELRSDLPQAPPLEGPGGRARLLEGIASTIIGLIGGHPPGVVVFDDVHWSDPDSLEVLGMLLHRFGERPGMVILSYRTEHLEPDHPVAGLIREARLQDAVTVLRLSRLNQEQVAELVAETAPDLTADAADIHRASEGVPFLVIQYLTAKATDADLESIPEGVRDLMAERLSVVSDLGRQIAGAAAVLGRTIDVPSLRQVGGRSDEETVLALEELLAKGLIAEVAASDSLDFTHDRLRQYVYESMNQVRRRLLHGRAADAALAARSDTGPAAIAARHLEQAGRLEEAAQQHRIAADQSVALFANRDAILHYEAALALGHPDTEALRESLADMLTLAGDYGAAIANLEAAAATATGADLARLEHKIGSVHARTGDWEMADARFAAAEAALDGNRAERSRVLAEWSSAVHRQGRADEARELAQQALDDANIADDGFALATAHNIFGIVERSHDLDAARRHHETSLALVADLDPMVRAAALNNLALTYLAAGDPEAGLEHATHALELCRLVGDRHKEAALHSNIADLLHAAGREGEALEELKISAAFFAGIGIDSEALEPEIWMLTEW